MRGANARRHACTHTMPVGTLRAAAPARRHDKELMCCRAVDAFAAMRCARCAAVMFGLNRLDGKCLQRFDTRRDGLACDVASDCGRFLLRRIAMERWRLLVSRDITDGYELSSLACRPLVISARAGSHHGSQRKRRNEYAKVILGRVGLQIRSIDSRRAAASKRSHGARER